MPRAHERKKRFVGKAVRLTAEESDLYEALAARLDCSVSELIRRSVATYAAIRHRSWRRRRDPPTRK